MTAFTLQPALQNYLGRVASLSNDYVPSLFWEKILTHLNMTSLEGLKDASPATFEKLVQEMNKMPLMGYAFQELEPGVEDVTQTPEYLKDKKRAKSFLKLHSRFMIPKFHDFLANKEQWEHMYSLRILKEFKYLDDYEQFLKPFRVKSNMSTIRHYYYLRRISQLAEENLGKKPLTILEVGAGAGNLSTFLAKSGLVHTYCIVDLPQMLLLSAYTISKYLPDAEIVFEDSLQEDQPLTRPRFVFVPAMSVDQVPARSFDLCINMFSFQEMDQEARDKYIATFYRVGKEDAMLFNVNRRQRRLPLRDGGVFDNNPLLYPYQHSDKVIHWEECPFHEKIRGMLFPMSLSTSRAAIINPTK